MIDFLAVLRFTFNLKKSNFIEEICFSYFISESRVDFWPKGCGQTLVVDKESFIVLTCVFLPLASFCAFCF